MIEEVVEELFNALFMLTDLRQILRENKPIYNFDEDQKEQIKGAEQDITEKAKNKEK